MNNKFPNQMNKILQDYKNNEILLEQIPIELWETLDFAIQICNISQSATNYIYINHDHYFNNAEFVLSTMKNNSAIFSFLSEDLISNKEFWIKLLTINPEQSLLFADKSIQQDLDVGRLSLTYYNYPLLNKHLKNDMNHILKIISNQPILVKDLSSDILNNKENMFQIFEKNQQSIMVFLSTYSTLLYDEDLVINLLEIINHEDAIFKINEKFITKNIILSQSKHIERNKESNLYPILKQYLREVSILESLNINPQDFNQRNKKKI